MKIVAYILLTVAALGALWFLFTRSGASMGGGGTAVDGAGGGGGQEGFGGLATPSDSGLDDLPGTGTCRSGNATECLKERYGGLGNSHGDPPPKDEHLGSTGDGDTGDTGVFTSIGLGGAGRNGPGIHTYPDPVTPKSGSLLPLGGFKTGNLR